VRWHQNSIATLRETPMGRDLLAATEATAP